MATTPKRRLHPLLALRALRALIRDPDDTAQVFRIVDALSSGSGERSYRRFRATPAGARILRERRSLLPTLADHAALLALPSGSLGRSYAEFVGREQLSADGLVEASREGRSRDDLDPERRLVGERMRDSHDLWHVVTGFGRDLVGEAALLAFTFAQTRNPGIGLIVAFAWLRARGDFAPARRQISDGYRRGRRAGWLPAQDWEALLPQPLTEVRRQLGLGEPPVYAPLRSSTAPKLAY